MALYALLITLLGALLVYLAHPRQRLRERPLSATARGMGYAALLAGALAWCRASGTAAGIASVSTAAMFAWVLLPYVAWWRGKHIQLARANRR